MDGDSSILPFSDAVGCTESGELYALLRDANSLERSTFLGKTLVGNLLSFSKTIGYTVPDMLVCGVSVKPVKVSLKGVHLMGFSGSFRVNFEIPDLLGIGKSVSRGMGTVKRGDVSDAARH